MDLQAIFRKGRRPKQSMDMQTAIRSPRPSRAAARLSIGLVLCLMGTGLAAQPRLQVFAGAAAKPALEELARLYERRTGTGVALVLGGSGTVLTQMRLARSGDLYLPGSSDYMARARREGLVLPETERPVAWLVPTLTVPHDNPARVRTLRDLLRPGLRVLLANPETVCLGAYAVEIFEHAFTPDERAVLRRNLVNYTDSCERTAAVVAMKQADVTVGWHVFAHWYPDRLITVRLPPEQVLRIGYLPMAVSRFTQDRAAAERFLDFVTGPEGRAVFARHGYFESPEAALQWLGAQRPVGGEYEVPRSWLMP